MISPRLRVSARTNPAFCSLPTSPPKRTKSALQCRISSGLGWKMKNHRKRPPAAHHEACPEPRRRAAPFPQFRPPARWSARLRGRSVEGGLLRDVPSTSSTSDSASAWPARRQRPLPRQPMVSANIGNIRTAGPGRFFPLWKRKLVKLPNRPPR